ncbi:MAG: nucleotidyltransferase family protein [Anaerolineae bacterium]|nr:nucleotidyltransferase family protein [Anaerolineae bacterium]MDH7473012.1 nucleotidyltransferase family protein [Anaerolineae bacterium]
MLLEEIGQQLLPILRRHGVIRAAIFGSFARGEAEAGSDLDILVDLPDTKSLLDLVALKLDLEAALGREVDVLTYRALHPRIRDRVLREQVVIYG